jgi:hypothetical protein
MTQKPPIGTPRKEALLPPPLTVIRAPSATPVIPRTQVLHIGTPRVTEPAPQRSPSPDHRARTPFTLLEQSTQPLRPQISCIGGTPQLPGQPRER